MMNGMEPKAGEISINNIGVVIVTYGDRVHFLAKVLKGVFKQTEVHRIKCVVVCDNGAEKGTKILLKSLANHEPKLRVVTLSQNTGSANGYAVAIKEAINCGCEWIWCLDDDNLPEPDALGQLIQTKNLVEPNAALLSLREDRPSYVKRACGLSLSKAFGPRYSFLGFSVLDLPQKIKPRLFRSIAPTGLPLPKSEEPLKVPYAPYGGFFFKATQIAEIGFPDASFYVYGDDHEFTRRFVAKGYSIYLVPKSRIKDLEQPWHQNRMRSALWTSNLLLHEGEEKYLEKLFYTIRNRVFLEMYSFGWKRNPLYYCNMLSYLALLFIQAFILRLKGKQLPWRSFFLILKAVKDGRRGRLGQIKGSLS